MVSVVVSYSSLEAPFLPALVREAALFSDDIVAVSNTHLFDGTPEVPPTVPAPARHIVQQWSPEKPPKHWHNNARWLGAQAAPHDWVLFVDGDEVPEGARMHEWVMNDLRGRSSSYDAYSFGCYWYFRNPTLRATKEFECAVMLRKALCTEEFLHSPDERWEFRKHPNIQAQEHVTDTQGAFWHHYSWVRSKKAMLKKVASWAHKNDRDWPALIEAESARPFAGTDLIFGFTYEQAPNRFGIVL